MKKVNYFCIKILIRLSHVKIVTFFKYTFFVLQYNLFFYITLKAQGILFSLMASCLHRIFQMNQFYYI